MLREPAETSTSAKRNCLVGEGVDGVRQCRKNCLIPGKRQIGVDHFITTVRCSAMPAERMLARLPDVASMLKVAVLPGYGLSGDNFTLLTLDLLSESSHGFHENAAQLCSRARQATTVQVAEALILYVVLSTCAHAILFVARLVERVDTLCNARADMGD